MSFNGDIAERLWKFKGLEPREGWIGGWKAVHPDLTTRNGFQWPAEGKVAATGPFTTGDACPSTGGDGLCVAITFRGAASGSIPAITGLLVEYRKANVLGANGDKVRVKSCRVAGIVDVARAIRGADLRGADLRGADLRGADLYGAIAPPPDAKERGAIL